MQPSKGSGQTWKSNRQNTGAQNYQQMSGEQGARSQSSVHPFYTANGPNPVGSEVRDVSSGKPATPHNFPLHRPPNHFPFVPPAPIGFSPHGQIPPPFFPPPPPFLGANQLPPSLHPYPPPPFMPPSPSIPQHLPHAPPVPMPHPHVPNVSLGLDSLRHELQMSVEELEKLRQLLTNVLDRCNQSDMALAKQWILNHCQSTKTLGKLFHILWGLRQPKKFDTTLRMLYLANDLLFHERKHSSAWIIPDLVPHLAPLSNEASMLAGSPAQREQLSKLIELWETQKCLTIEQISHIRNAMLLPEAKPFLPSHPMLGLPPRPPAAMVPYYKVPAGFMVELCKDNKAPYTPIPVRDASMVPMLPQNAAADLASALTDFYEGMDGALFNPNLPPPIASPLEWQPGFLDKWQSELQNKLQPSSRSTSCSRGRSRERSYSRSVSRSPSRASYSSRDCRSPRRRRRAYSSHRSRSRSYSSRSRSFSPNRNPGAKRARSQSSSRSGSPRRSLNYSRSPDAKRYFRK